MARKILWYVKRYAKAEIASTLAALAVYLLAKQFSQNEILCAYAMTMGENIGFYGVIVLREFSASAKKYHGQHKASHALRAAGNTVAEFGPSEVLDSLFLRPAAIAAALFVIGNDLTGALVGKILADIIFYSVAASSREMREKFLSKDRI